MDPAQNAWHRAQFSWTDVLRRVRGGPNPNAPNASPWAPISAYSSARSDRKGRLAKLRLDDGPLRGLGGSRAGWQLQHCRALAITQARD
jgi:hypothetical protein